MRIPNYYDEEALSNLLTLQKSKAWDLEKSINWDEKINFSKPLVALDANNIAFPFKITSQQRLAVSQMMGLMMASTFSEMELALGRLREISWDALVDRYAINPEIIELGHEFFDEEEKHALAFDRYIEMFAEGVGVSLKDLKSILPTVKPGIVQNILESNAKSGGMLLWWIVATVEEQSQMIFLQMKKFKDDIDPLYYQLHQLHFEEEARHAPYAFMILKIVSENENSFLRKLNNKKDYLASELTRMLWLSQELSKILKVGKFKKVHPFFKNLCDILPLMKKQSFANLMMRFLKSTPYISPFLNPGYHKDLSALISDQKVWHLPIPKPTPDQLEW